MLRLSVRLSCLVLASLLVSIAAGQSVDPPTVTVSLSNGQSTVSWPIYPAAQVYHLLSGPSLNAPMTDEISGVRDGFSWTGPMTPSNDFFRLMVEPVDADALFALNLLQRAAYGPTPDELERVVTGPNAIGPHAYLEELLAPQDVADTIDSESPRTNWIYRVAQGAATGTNLILYFNGPGDVYLDDIVLVAGTEAEQGANLVRNGDFESPILIPPFAANSNYATSEISTTVSHSGGASLHLIGAAAGSSAATGFYQPVAVNANGAVTYTLSYWYLPNQQSEARTLTVRLSGSLLSSAHDIRPERTPALLRERLDGGTAILADLRAWYLMHCVRSKHQLLEVLTQFLENHFVTQHSKTYDYFDGFYDGGTLRDQIATSLEWREVSRWRQALLNPACRFYDLLKISAESPAMIIYLDTVASRGDGGRIANENYARELLELFCNGVDNGYDQNDIVECSKTWTGWSVDIVDAQNVDNPLAPRSTTLIDTNYPVARSNLVGVWTFNYLTNRHNNNAKHLFAGKTVDARFGPPWAGRPYQLDLPARNGAPSLQDGYDVIRHLADLPYAQEFISVKLCRLFVHDDFVHGVYDYRDEANLSPEAKLVHDCMLAWEGGEPKGQIRDVLRVIFNSELFRSHGGSLQKVKTPLEFAASTIRAFRAGLPSGQFTADTDGYSLTGTGRTTASAPVPRMGNMFLFDRPEPDGYPEAGPPWISAGTLVERMRFVQALLITPGETGKGDAGANNYSNPIDLLKARLPNQDLNNDEAVAAFFLGLLYPAEGKANLYQYAGLAKDFLNTADDGVTPSAFADLGIGSANYIGRVRGMAGMLLTLARFQEQ
jgi:uncharacterized protein (DUF1800 family)